MPLWLDQIFAQHALFPFPVDTGKRAASACAADVETGKAIWFQAARALTVVDMLQHSGTPSYPLLIFFETTLSTGECTVMLTAVYLSVGLV